MYQDERSCRFELRVVYTLVLAGLWTRDVVRLTLFSLVVVFSLATLRRAPLGTGHSKTAWTRSLEPYWLLPLAMVAALGIWAIGAAWGTAHLSKSPSIFDHNNFRYTYQAALQEIFLLKYVFIREESRCGDRSPIRTAKMFAAWHFPNPVLMPLTFLSGFLTAVYYKKHRNVWVPIIWHAIVGGSIATYWPKWTMVVGIGFWQDYAWPSIVKAWASLH